MSERRVLSARTAQKRDTTANWNSKMDFIPLKGEIIVYTDYFVKEGHEIANMKIGDGVTRLSELAFMISERNDKTEEHINNSDIHVSPSDRIKWTNKLNCLLDGENLILNRN